MASRGSNIKKLTVSSLLAALTCLGTLAVLNYSPAGGYIHLGDCLVLLSGFLMGPLWGGIAAGLGAALTDLILGCAAYIPATFLIKWGVAAVAVLVAGAPRWGDRCATVKCAIGAVAGECLMVGGYFVYELLLYGVGGAVAGVIPNVIQGTAGAIAAMLLVVPIKKIKYLHNFWI